MTGVVLNEIEPTQGPYFDSEQPETMKAAAQTDSGPSKKKGKAVAKSLRDRIVLDHLPLVKAIAVRVHENLPVHVDLDDQLLPGPLSAGREVRQAGAEAVAPARLLAGGRVRVQQEEEIPLALEARGVCGKIARTLPLAFMVLLSRRSSIDCASRTASPCQSRACPV